MKIYKIIIALGISVLIFSALSPVFAADPVNPFQFGIKKKATNPEMTGWKFLPDITQCGAVTRDANGKLLRKYDFGTCLLWLFNKILSIIYTLALLLGVIFLVYAGIEYITKPGDAKSVHQRLTWGIVGIVVAIVAFSLVKAIEISLTTEGGGGTISSVPTAPAGGGGGEDGEVTPTTPESTTGKPQVIVDNISFIPEGSFYTIIFSERLDTEDSTKSCNVDLRIFNLSNGRTRQYSFMSDNVVTLHGRKDEGGTSIDPPIGSKQGDKIQLQFLQNQNCQVPSPVTLIVPKIQTGPGAPIIAQRPQIRINAPAILGQQRFKIEIPENLQDVVFQVLDVYFRQARLYDPPFYMYLRYSNVGGAATQSTTCTFVINISGVRVSSYSSNPYKAVNLKVFNLPPLSLNLKLDKGVENYSKMFYVSMSNNIIERVKIRAIELKNCDYAGGNVGVWAYTTQITTGQ